MKITVEQIQKHIDSFNEIYNKEGKEINPIPEDVKLTVYCSGPHESGFVINKEKNQIGLVLLIAKSWILHSELKKLINENRT